MNIVNDIIKSIEKVDEPHPFDKYRKILSISKKLSKKENTELISMCKTRKLFDILNLDLTVKEARVIAHILKSIKIRNVDDVIYLLCKNNDNNTPVLLSSILTRKFKIEDFKPIVNYLKSIIKGEIKLNHLHLIKVVNKNYPNCIDEDILNFCKNNGHDICKNILNVEMDVC